MVHFRLPGWISYSKQATGWFEMWDPNFGDVTCILSITYFQFVQHICTMYLYIYIHRLGKKYSQVETWNALLGKKRTR